MQFSILHLSDLHRDIADELETSALLNSLERDAERYGQETPTIRRPSVCLVTGDLIYGASPSATAEAELARQYAQTSEFLVGIADRFFGGKRERVVVLPGNHDVSMPAVMRSVVAVPVPTDASEKRVLSRELFAPGSLLRWSWSDLCFYRIVDEAGYRSRLAHFAEFYAAFYQGKRRYSLDAAMQHDVFEFADLNFSIFSASSCHNNDPLRKAGAIHPNAASEICRLARAPTRSGRLIAAAWHHNLHGGPARDDYLDSGVLQLLIDSGVSIGFHGHQHMVECVDERYRVGPDPRKITVVSAGTLCGAPHHLVAGEPRSFNVVEIDTERWTGRVHQRRMVNHDYALPIWGAGHLNSTNASYIDFDISPPLAPKPKSLDVQLALERGEALLASRSWVEAAELLTQHKDEPLARPFLMAALNEIDDPQRTIASLWPPTTIAEAVVVGGAIIDAGVREQAESFLALPLVSEGEDASLGEVARRVRERRLR